ncbi:MAG: hypothetical protein V1656_01925 [Candidatus Jorgensenbacteria bacterium]
MLLDVVVLPPPELREKVGRKIKKAAAGYPAGFVVDNKKFIPHLSLWHLKTDKSKIDGLAKKLEGVVKHQKPLSIHSAAFNVEPMVQGVIVEFPIRKNAALSVLREKVFSRAYHFKTGIVPPFKPFGIPKGKALVETKKYGRPLGFYPHFTMGWLESMKDSRAVQRKMKKTKFSFTAKEIYICEINRWWQVTRIVKKIDFGQ